MTTETIKVPDIGSSEAVEVIEILINVEDSVTVEQSLIVLESDKASLEVPSPMAGKITKLHVKTGASVSEGDAIADIEVEGESAADDDNESDNASQSEAIKEGQGEKKDKAATGEKADNSKKEDREKQEVKGEGDDNDAQQANNDKAQAAEKADAGEEAAQSAERKSESPAIAKELLPNIGDVEGVEVIEILVAVGDSIAEGDSIVVLESDKASMEVPVSRSGKVHALHVKEGDEVSEGSLLLELEVGASEAKKENTPDKQQATEDTQEAGEADQDDGGPQEAQPETEKGAAGRERAAARTNTKLHARIADAAVEQRQVSGAVYAGPAVRKLARELGVDLAQVKGTGPKDRIVKDDIESFVKEALKHAAAGTGSGVPAVPEIDFSKFGEIDQQPLSKLNKLTAKNMARSWLNVPHVTHFDDADITELEDFRASLKADMEKRGVKLSPLPFIVKASARALQMNPKFNSSLLPDGEQIAFKHYYHIGLAVDTPAGLMVPVLRDVDKKSIWEIAEEMQELSGKARERKLSPAEMQGGCFTLSSLGNIGGSGFTPIINTPEVAILGISRTTVKPVYIDAGFVPRKMLPLALSYDHRVVNGADAGRFMTDLCQLMADIRRQLL